MKALATEVSLPTELNRLTDPDLDLLHISRIVPLGDGSLVVLLTGCGEAPLRFLEPDGNALKPLSDLANIESVWPAGPEAVLVQSQGALWRVEGNGQKGKLLDLPLGLVSLDAAWHVEGVRMGAFVDRRLTPAEEVPRIYPTPWGKFALCRHTPQEGWRGLTEVPAGCNGLSISADGRRMVWQEPLNIVPEEANRGEFRGFDLDTGNVGEITAGAGQAKRALIAPDGSGILYQANHQTQRPITTHTDVWWTAWNGKERRNLTGGGCCVVDFGWGTETDEIWISFVRGMEQRTRVMRIDGSSASRTLGFPATSRIAWLPSGGAAFETEGMADYPVLRTDGRRVTLPQPEIYEDFHVSSIRWQSSDGLKIEGILCETDATPLEAPLLVAAHGGPANPVYAIRSRAVRYRHLLRAGYRVFLPTFRGSLGFGDAFAQGNIGCQGDADLKDILTGIDYLIESGRAMPEQCGIFGASYGGYMTLRALAVCDRFQAGVAIASFIDNRWMTLETGDFTYETEYLEPLSWPPTETSRRSNVFPHLGSIDAPLLLIHGDADPICPLSHAVVTYRALAVQGHPVGLVVYPGEGHGFNRPENQRDCAQRLLAFFMEYLPVSGH